MSWPQSLIPEVSARRCIIFLGAGASSGCMNIRGEHPPDWPTFLTNANNRYTIDRDEKTLCEGLIRQGTYLDAAEIIFSHINDADARRYYREVFSQGGYSATQLHETIKEIDSKIVITTNYDQIYENQCLPHMENGYIVKTYHNDDILDEIRSDTRLIIKAHGCVTTPGHIILTRSQYFEAKKKYPQFYNLLDSLFLTNTIIFIGCGLSDPDIQLILENTNIAVPSQHPHYALVPSGKHPALKRSIKKSYNIQLIEYDNSNGTHSESISMVKELLDNVQAYRRTYAGSVGI